MIDTNLNEFKDDFNESTNTDYTDYNKYHEYSEAEILELFNGIQEAEQQELYEKFHPNREGGFWAFCQYMDSAFFTDEKTLLKDYAQILQDISSIPQIGRIGSKDDKNKVYESKIPKYSKSMISIMPRTGKSYQATLWCAWLLGYCPEGKIMRCSYSDKPAKKFSDDLRKIVGIPNIGMPTEAHLKYIMVFPWSRLRNKSIDKWALETAIEDSFICGGWEGGITGFGCNLAAILDDPVKDERMAASETKMQSLWKWKLSTFDTRIEENSNCPQVIIMTRWAEIDTAGMVEKYEGIIGDEDFKEKNGMEGVWKKFVFPALIENENGDLVSICEAIQKTETLLRKRNTMLNSGEEVVWNALYMQNPDSPDGKLFHQSMLNFYRESDYGDEHLRTKIMFVDAADDGSDYLSAPIGVLREKTIDVCDVVFTKDPIEVTVTTLANKIIMNNIVRVVFEKNNGGKALMLMVRNKLYEMGYTRATLVAKREKEHKRTKIFVNAGIIKSLCRFRSDIADNKEYKLFMKYLTRYVNTDMRSKDDAPDSLVGLTKMFKGSSVIDVRIY